MYSTKNTEYEIADKINKIYPTITIIKNQEEPYTIYKMSDIEKLFNFKNIRGYNYQLEEKINIKHQTPGGLQNVGFLTYKGLCKLICNSRKQIPEEFIKILEININTTKFTCIETDTIKCILNTFEGEEYVLQYKILNYRIDLYFPKYKLAIECDEYHYNIENDKIRETEIINKLNCVFIRYKPYDKKFNIFNLLNQIYNHIITNA
jgi:very-short-patch-repair endonuclease